ncbi:MAG TPA: hypothetical protein VIZ31_10210, partial [Vicinamibacteria bacterium]
GRSAEGSRHLERALALGIGDEPSTLANLAIVRATRGDVQEAGRLLEQLKAESARRYVSPVLPALVHAALGQKDDTFALLEQAYAARDPVLVPIQVGEVGAVLHLAEARVAELRADPRFGDLVRRMGFAPQPPAAKPR